MPRAAYETPQQVAAAGSQLGTGTENEISEVVAGLRRRHPTASQGMIINYRVTAYCPTIKADRSLNRPQKQEKMQAFSSREGVGRIAGKPWWIGSTRTVKAAFLAGIDMLEDPSRELADRPP